MDQLLNSLPKSVIAVVALFFTLLFLIRMNPPVTACDAQMELFRDSQKLFLYRPKAVGNVSQVSRIEALVKICKEQNSPGGCFELFTGLKKTVVDLRNIPEQCLATAREEPEIQRWLWASLRLMVQSAWGDRMPVSYVQKNGWFDSSELTLFCDLRRHAIRIFGYETFQQWQEGMLASGMPNVDKMSRDQVWPRSILSTSCESYR